MSAFTLLPSARDSVRRILLFLFLALAAAPTFAQSESGDVCLQDYVPGAVCTANDVRIVEFRVLETIAACGAETPGMATVRLQAFVSSANAPDRYDLGFFVATDGGSALDGDSCLHDFLGGGISSKPSYGDVNGDGVDDLGSAPWQSGGEPEGDTCGDIRADSQVFKSIDTVTIPCNDSNGDGTVDISACASWDNNKSNGSDNSPHCTSVQNALPGTNSKCSCDESVEVVGLPVEPGAIDLTKLPATQTVASGGSAQFTLTATNPTDVPLTNVVLEDGRCTTLTGPEGDANGNAILERGESWTWSCTTANVTEDFTNVGIVLALANDESVTDTASADVVVTDVEPPPATGAIDLTKLPATQTVEPGGNAEFELAATNPTDVPLTNVVMSDPRCTSLGEMHGDANGNGSLERGETWTWTCRTTNVVEDFTNVATVTATANEQTVTDQATADVEVAEVSPPQGTGAVDLTKLPATQTIDQGTSATFTLTATNPTDVPLTNVVLEDGRCTTLTGPEGDANSNAILERGETWTWQCVTENVEEAFTNVGIVLALANDQSVTDTATADVLVTQVSPPGGTGVLDLTKTLQSMTMGEDGLATIAIRIEVVNTGTEPMTNVVVTDPLSNASGGTFGTYVSAPRPTDRGTYTVTPVVAQGGLTASSTFTGHAENTIVATGDLDVGEGAILEFTILLLPMAEGQYVNQAFVNGTGSTSVGDTDEIGVIVGQGVNVQASIPVDAPWALILLALGVGLVAMRRLQAG